MTEALPVTFPFSVKRLVTRAVILPLLLAAVVAGLFAWQVDYLLATNRAVEHSDDIVDRANHLEKLLVDMETGLRGYVITKQASFLDPYAAALDPTQTELGALRTLVADNPPQRERLAAIIQQSLAWLAYARDLKSRVGHADGAESLVTSEQGKRLMDELREEIGTFVATETATRDGLSSVARSSTYYLLGTCVVLTLICGGIIAVLARQQLLLLGRAYADGLRAAQEQQQERTQLLASQRTQNAELALANEHLRQEMEARKAAEGAQILLGAIVESSDEAIISKTLDGIITSWNRGAQELFGYTAEEAVGKSILLIVPPERHDEERNILAQLGRGQRITHFETERVAKDGHRVEVSLTVSPVRNFEGTVVGASKIARDISNRLRVQRERETLLGAERHAREEAQRANRLKDEFLATLSHELRTPVNAILGWAQILRQGKREPTDLDHGLETIERNARVQARLIEDLLDMSRIISGKLRLDIQRIAPATFIEAAIEAVRPAAEAKGVRLEKILDAVAGPISGDPNRLQQVVWNLVSNAVKFTPKGGKVQVILERVNSHLDLSVADTGQGIKTEFLPNVFDRFRQADPGITRRFGGLGLGLAIVKQLVELHGGTVRAKSAGENLGATFIVSLPLTAVHMQPSDGDRQHPHTPSLFIDCESADLSGLRILVVEDESDARDLVKRVLEECKAEVFTVASALAAFALIEQLQPHVIVSDIGMPEMDGYDFLRRLRALPAEKGGRTPAVALTAFARSEDRTRAMLAGYQVHVAKPVEPQELLASVASVAGRTAIR